MKPRVAKLSGSAPLLKDGDKLEVTLTLSLPAELLQHTLPAKVIGIQWMPVFEEKTNADEEVEWE